MNLSPKSLHKDFIKGKTPGTTVCIHGNSSSMKVFDHFFKAEFDYSRLRFDLPGHGDSYRSDDSEMYSYDNYRKTILTLIDEIDDDIVLYGNSLGGHLAMDIAPQVKNLKGLIIAGSPPVRKPLNMEEAWLPFPHLQNMFKEDVPEGTVTEMFSLAVANQEVLPTIVSDFIRADPRNRSAAMAEIVAGNIPDEVEIFQALEVKKYILHGLQDPTPNPEYMRSIMGDAQMIEIDNCGHYPSIEQPEVFLNIVSGICKEVFGWQ
jgi:pimeloyl-ACP methyl ester carboxylesterase